MTRLLVSVRDVAEAQLAVAAEVDLIDVKEPSTGSLGAADPETWQAIREVVPARIPVSLACGELVDERQLPNAKTAGEKPPRDIVPHVPLTPPAAVPEQIAFAKRGLAHCAQVPDWTRAWLAWQRGLPPATQAVAVIYADWQACQAPSPQDVIEKIPADAAAAVLVDTYHKDGRSTFDHLPLGTLDELFDEARCRGWFTVLAGSITRQHLPRVFQHAPDYLAVRGAVCQQNRTGRLSGQLIRQLREQLPQKKVTGAS